MWPRIYSRPWRVNYSSATQFLGQVSGLSSSRHRNRVQSSLKHPGGDRPAADTPERTVKALANTPRRRASRGARSSRSPGNRRVESKLGPCASERACRCERAESRCPSARTRRVTGARRPCQFGGCSSQSGGDIRGHRRNRTHRPAGLQDQDLLGLTMKRPIKQFALCLENAGNEASLILSARLQN